MFISHYDIFGIKHGQSKDTWELSAQVVLTSWVIHHKCNTPTALLSAHISGHLVHYQLRSEEKLKYISQMHWFSYVNTGQQMNFISTTAFPRGNTERQKQGKIFSWATLVITSHREFATKKAGKCRVQERKSEAATQGLDGRKLGRWEWRGLGQKHAGSTYGKFHEDWKSCVMYI